MSDRFDGRVCGLRGQTRGVCGGVVSTWGRKGRAGSAPPSPASRYPALLSLSWPLLQHKPQRELPGGQPGGGEFVFLCDKSEVAGESHGHRETPRDQPLTPPEVRREAG